MIKYLKWYISTMKCEHDYGKWRMIDTGMGKIRCCNKCGKTLQVI